MLNIIKQIFGLGPKTDYKALVQQGSVIIDVRTPEEYKRGHIKGSINIPLNHLVSNLKKIPKNKPIIVCCASGARSANAKHVLKSNGYQDVYNGGGWTTLHNKIA